MFDSIVGQDRIVSILKRLRAGDRIPHAMLFHGQPGTGPVAAALEMARSLHCETGGNGACGACPGCRKTEGMNHPDFSVLFPMPARTTQEDEWKRAKDVRRLPYGYDFPEESAVHSVEKIRDLQRRLAMGTFEGSWRSAVILHAEKMRPEAANALLKTLEEPPARTLLVLTAPSTEALLPTIVSRSQTVRFSSVPDPVLANALQKDQVQEERARFIAQASGGNVRIAIQMVASEGLDVYDRAFSFLEAMIWGEPLKTFTAIERLVAEKTEVFPVLSASELWLRDVLMLRCGLQDRISQPSKLKEVRRLVEAFDVDRLLATIQRIESIREMARRNVNLQLALVSLWNLLRTYSTPSAGENYSNQPSAVTSQKDEREYKQ